MRRSGVRRTGRRVVTKKCRVMRETEKTGKRTTAERKDMEGTERTGMQKGKGRRMW